jgi:uncharacterized membrane protein YjdF
MWDSQEDMFVAGLGSVIGVLIIAALVRRRNARNADRAVVVAARS